MEQLFVIASVWLGLAVISAIIAYHLRISIALVEICVGVVTGGVLALLGKPDILGSNAEWLRFLASSGAILLTFLAGAELDPDVLRSKVKEVSLVGFVGFFAPFFGCAAAAYYVLGWNYQASLLCGVALSTTSMAVVYAVMLETGLNKTEFGKGILGACFINDLGTVIALGLLFSPFTYKTLVFIITSGLVLALLPFVTHGITRVYAHRTAAIRTKWVMLVLFGLGALALWSGSEGVLPAYIAGMVLAGKAAKDEFWIQALAHFDYWFSYAFLLSPRRHARFSWRPHFGTSHLPCAARWKGALQNFWSVPVHPAIQTRRQRALVLYPPHVYRTDIRYDFGPVRPIPWHRDSGAILLSRGYCYS